MLACARIGAVHSVVFGGFAPAELAARIEDARPKVIVSASCGIEPSRVVEYKPMLDAAIERSSHQPEHCVDPAARAGAAAMGERDLDWADADAPGRHDRPGASRSRRPTRSTSSTPPAPPAGPRASCATTAATRWRCAGRWRNIFDVGPGEVWWTASDVGWVVGHSYIVYAPLLAGCTTVLYEGKPVGTPDAGAFWRVVAEHGVSRAVHRADRDPGDQEGGPGRRADGRARPVLAAHAVPGRRAARPRHLRLGERAARRPGHRQLVADRDRLADRGQPARAWSRCRSSPARRPCRCPATTCGCSTSAASRSAPASRARSACGCRCRRARCRRCGRTTSGTSRRTCRRSRATT